jgi:hypothetical protein
MRTLTPIKRVQGPLALDLKQRISRALADGSNRQPHDISILSGRTIRAKYFESMPIDLIVGKDDRDKLFKFRIECILNIVPTVKK